jgi:pimeloyl-ACP methyl ester carboxylesterase
MWKPIIPVLAEPFTVIAPDLPGIGDSDIPADKLDMKNAAIRIHDLTKSLGVQKAELVNTISASWSPTPRSSRRK